MKDELTLEEEEKGQGSAGMELAAWRPEADRASEMRSGEISDTDSTVRRRKHDSAFLPLSLLLLGELGRAREGEVSTSYDWYLQQNKTLIQIPFLTQQIKHFNCNNDRPLSRTPSTMR